MPIKAARNGQYGSYNTTLPTLDDQDDVGFQFDSRGRAILSLGTALAGEDLSNDVIKVEQRFTSSGLVTSDTAVKSGAGFLHTVTIAQGDAAPTAGTIDIRDNTAAGAGTILFSWTLTTAVFVPFTVIIDTSFTVGLYADITTTADVNVFLSYR